MAIGKVICIGDSLTAGAESDPSGYRSYRGALQLLLNNAGYTVDFVGTQSSAPAAGGSDPNHDGYGGARMDSSDSATNSIEGRIADIRDEVGPVDIVILGIGWNDAYSATSDAATKYSDLLTTIRAGDWASAKIVMLTLHPEPNKTAAQTGSDYTVYAQINAQIRAEVDANHIVADLAALTAGGTSGDATEMLETLLYDAQNGPEYSTTKLGNELPALWGGHEHTSFKSMQDFHAQWSRTPPWPRVGGNGTTDVSDDHLFHQDPNVAGHPIFINSVRAVVPWFWAFTGPGHNANNTGLEVRNAFAQSWNAQTNQWDFYFEGARIGGDWASYQSAPHDPSDGEGTVNQWRSDGITTIIKPHENIGVEVWPEDTVPSRGVAKFFGGFNRSAMANAKCFIVGAQVRLALVDPNGTNDISRAVLLASMGLDFFADNNGYSARYDYYGWSLTACDGGKDRWKRIRSTDWVWIGSITIGNGSGGGHYNDPGLKPPLGYRWSPATPYNDIPTYSVSAADLRANPPRLPRYVSGSTTTPTSAWITTDYWLNPSTGARDIHWTQQGADRAAGVIFGALVQAGWLSTFTGGDVPISFGLLPGIPTVGKWGARYTTEATDPDTAAWATVGPAQNSAPTWPNPYGLPQASSGAAYSATLTAQGTPTPTYSHVSGKPTWMSVASNGAITGTPDETSTFTYSITFRASNSEGDADITLPVQVVIGPVVTTTSLPSTVAGAAYLQQIAAAGTGVLTWSVVSGQSSLTACGLSVSSAGWVSGTAIAGTANFTVRVTNASGVYADQSLTVVVAAGGTAPAITTTAMVSGVVGLAYNATIAASGSGTITRRLVAGALPPGLTLVESTGVVSGTPTTAGTFAFTVRPESDYGVGQPASLSVTVFASSVTAVADANPFSRLFGAA